MVHQPSWFVRFCRHIAPIARDPRVDLAMGAAVLIIGLAEVLDDVLMSFDTGLGWHHGLILFGSVTSLRAVLDMLEGAEKVIVANGLEG
jgi:hypothetical protein